MGECDVGQECIDRYVATINKKKIHHGMSTVLESYNIITIIIHSHTAPSACSVFLDEYIVLKQVHIGQLI